MSLLRQYFIDRKNKRCPQMKTNRTKQKDLNCILSDDTTTTTIYNIIFKKKRTD